MSAAPPTVLHVYPSFAIGGAQRRFAQLANHFAGAYRHVVVALDGCVDAASLLAPSLDCRFLTVATGGGLAGRLRRYRHLIGEVAPDLLITANWGSIEWAMANRDGRVRQLHLEDGFGREEADRQIPRRVWLRRLMLRHATVIVPSHSLLRLAREVWRLPPDRVTMVANGVDLARFSDTGPKGFAPPYALPEDRPVIGTITALRPEKALTRLLDAVAALRRHRPVHLVIAGEGPSRPALEEQARALGIADDTGFVGHCPRPEQLLSRLTLFALSSDTEQMPLSLIEAMAAGRAVAATDVGDVRLMLPAVSQPFVVPRDADALAAALAELLRDDDRRRAIGAANADHARRHFDQEAMFAAYRRLYDGVSTNRR